MNRNMFMQYAKDLKRLGVTGVGLEGFSLGQDGKYKLQYTPFEHVNREARLVIVGITPGNNQLDLAYRKAQELLLAGGMKEKFSPRLRKKVLSAARQ